MQKKGGVKPASSTASGTAVKTEGTKSNEVSTKSTSNTKAEKQGKNEADPKKTTLSAVENPEQKMISLPNSNLNKIGVTYAKNAGGKPVNYMYKSGNGGSWDTDAIFHLSLNEDGTDASDFTIKDSFVDLDYYAIRGERFVGSNFTLMKDNIFDANSTGFNGGKELKLKDVNSDKSYTLKAVTNTDGKKVVALQLDDGIWYDMNELLKGTKTKVDVKKS